MPKLVRAVKVNSPIDNVWDVVADLGELDMWSPSLVHQRDEISRGGIADEVKDYGFSFGADKHVRITEWETGSQIGYSISGVAGVKSLRNNIVIEPQGDDTKVTSIVNFEMEDSQANSFDISRDFELYMTESLACLKHYAETSVESGKIA